MSAFALRDWVPDDLPFVRKTWLEAERDALAHAEGKYFTGLQHAAMDAVLGKPSTRLIIASPEGDDSIAGWAALGSLVTAPVVYFVFVRPEARRLGIARLLLGGLCERRDVICTSRPARERDSQGVWRPSPVPIPRGWRFVPRAALLEPKERHA